MQRNKHVNALQAAFAAAGQRSPSTCAVPGVAMLMHKYHPNQLSHYVTLTRLQHVAAPTPAPAELASPLLLRCYDITLVTSDITRVKSGVARHKPPQHCQCATECLRI